MEIHSKCVFAVPPSLTFISLVNQEEYCVHSASKRYTLVYSISITYLFEFSMSSHRATR